MSGDGGGWSPHPAARDDHSKVRAPVAPGRVVGLGAICDLGPPAAAGERSQSFSVSEFVTLADGRRVLLHDERGFTIGWRSASGTVLGEVQRLESRDSLTRDVLTVVLPDDESPDQHPWSWLADLARARGLAVTAEDLRGLAYEVVLTDAVIRWLEPG